MTWQYYSVQPANEALLGHASGILPVIFCVKDTLAGFDYFQEMDNKDMAVCDIDACFTNCIELPKVPEEQMYIRTLNVRQICDSKLSRPLRTARSASMIRRTLTTSQART